jgi:hypothetical protein
MSDTPEIRDESYRTADRLSASQRRERRIITMRWMLLLLLGALLAVIGIWLIVITSPFFD